MQPFTYHRPQTADAAIEAFLSAGENARSLPAGRRFTIS